MSADVEVVKRLFEAFQRGDYEASLELLDPGVLWEDPPDMPDGGGPCRGREAVSATFVRFMRVWEDFRFHADEVFEAGGRVVAVTRWEGRGRESGVDVEQSVVQVYELRDGRVVRLRQFRRREDALAAAAEPA